MKSYLFRLVKYKSQRTKCFYLDEAGAWRVTGVSVPLSLRNRGFQVEWEEVTEKEHKESLKNDESRTKSTRRSYAQA